MDSYSALRCNSPSFCYLFIDSSSICHALSNDTRSLPCSITSLPVLQKVQFTLSKFLFLIIFIFNDKDLSLKSSQETSKQVQALHSRQYCSLQGNNNTCVFFFFFLRKVALDAAIFGSTQIFAITAGQWILQLHRARYFLVWLLSKLITQTRDYPCLPEVEGKHALIRPGPPAQLLSLCMIPLCKVCCMWERGRKRQCKKGIRERKWWRKAEIEGGPSPLEKQKTDSQRSPASRHHPADVQWPLVVHPASLHWGSCLHTSHQLTGKNRYNTQIFLLPARSSCEFWLCWLNSNVQFIVLNFDSYRISDVSEKTKPSSRFYNSSISLFDASLLLILPWSQW